MKNIKFLLISILMILTSACAYNTGVRTTEPVSYLYFTGDAQGVEVIIDDSPAFIVTEMGNKTLYKVTPGKHLIVIKRNGNIVVNRSVMLGDGHEKEFNIPKI